VTSDSRFVLDTGVLVRALLLPLSVPRQAVDLAFVHGIIMVSAATIDELNEVLRRPKFNRYLGEEERLLFLSAFIRDATVVDVTENITACRDAKDNKFLELAVAGDATCIVTGDHDLLVLSPFRGIPILSPQEFVSMRRVP
jgi:uncharacterized protein